MVRVDLFSEELIFEMNYYCQESCKYFRKDILDRQQRVERYRNEVLSMSTRNEKKASMAGV